MLDGPLAIKVPATAKAREQITRDVMTAMRSMLVAWSKPARAVRREPGRTAR
jgi:hypothetical protein